MAPPPLQTVSYPSTQIVVGDEANSAIKASILGAKLELVNVSAQKTALQSVSLSAEVPSFDMTFNALTLGGVASSGAGQVITSGAGGAPYWADLPAPQATPSLATVLGVSPEGGALDGQTISNLKSLAFSEMGSTSAFSPIVLGQTINDGYFQINCATESQLVDTNYAVTKQFTGAYMRITLNGSDFLLPCFQLVPP